MASSARELATIQLLGGARTLGARVVTSEDLRTSVRRGLPFRTLGVVLDGLRVPREQAARVLGLPLRTLARRRQAGTLAPDESDRLARLARIAGVARDVFGEQDIAARWLRRPNRALGGEAPIEMLDTDLGARRVEQILGRIEYGVPS